MRAEPERLSHLGGWLGGSPGVERLDPKRQSPKMCVENQPFCFWLSLAHLAQSEHKAGGRRQQAAKNSERPLSTLVWSPTVLGTNSGSAASLLCDLGQVTSPLCVLVSFSAQRGTMWPLAGFL